MALRSIPTKPLTRGARRLRRHLESTDTSVPAFCEANDLDRYEIQRLINGTTERIVVDLAIAVSGAVPGVRVEDFASVTKDDPTRKVARCKVSTRTAGSAR